MPKNTIQTSERLYELQGPYVTTELYISYLAQYIKDNKEVKVTLNVAKDPEYNNFILKEARILGELAKGIESENFAPYIPPLVETFMYFQNGVDHSVNVFPLPEGWYTLEQVRDRYPEGIDPKDMAWIFRRLLAAIGFAHLNNVIHGAVLPQNIFVLPEQHGLILSNWCFSAKITDQGDSFIQAISKKYEKWYPSDVIELKPAQPSIDLYMASEVMVHILGGNVEKRLMTPSVPDEIKTFISNSTSPLKRLQSQDAWELQDEFDILIEKLWGKRKFHPFTMN
jgi:hypothetical protein